MGIMVRYYLLRFISNKTIHLSHVKSSSQCVTPTFKIDKLTSEEEKKNPIELCNVIDMVLTALGSSKALV